MYAMLKDHKKRYKTKRLSLPSVWVALLTHTLLGSIFSVLAVHIFHTHISVFKILRDCVLPFSFAAGYSHPNRLKLLLKNVLNSCVIRVEGLVLPHTGCNTRGADPPPLHVIRVVLPRGWGHG